MEKILVLDNYDSFTYNLVHYIEANPNYSVDVFRNDEISLDAVDNYNTIVLSPGPGLPDEAGILKALIARYAPTKKILGVCLGMQAIGEVFGGTLDNLNNVFHGVATKISQTNTNDLIYKDLPETLEVGRYHSWVISNNNFPNELKITATDDQGQIMSIKHQQYNVYGVQYHPESILTTHGKEIIANFLDI
ncbi:MAG: anthranilate synthase component II [Flavobacteriaceae bacterium]